MCARSRSSWLALWAASLLAAAPAAAAGPGKAAATPAARTKAGLAGPGRTGARTPHPDTGGEQECAACHKDLTPAVFQAWEGSRHGLALVKCVACHGAPGDGFVRRPPAERCRGCHGAEVDSVRALGVRDCFTCHAPHSLSPNPHHR